MSRRFSFFMAVLILLPMTAGLARANIQTGPWLLNLSDRGVVIKWEAPEAAGRVEWGETDSLGNQVDSFFSGGIHEVSLDCLDPNTRYYYKVVSGSDESEVTDFYTGPSTEDPFTFIVFGDNRTDVPAHQAVVDAILLESPDFVLNTGDLVDIALLQSQWDHFWDVEQPLLDNVPVFPIMGNHEAYGGQIFFRKYFDNPIARDEYASAYAFAIGNSFFLNLDIARPHGEGSEQYQWADRMLQWASEAPSIRHAFVQGHFPPYSCSNHGEDLDVKYFRNVMVPLFEKYDIDLMFSGHDHTYQHSLVNDIDYIVAGGGGAPLYSVSPESWTVAAERSFNYVVVEVAGDAVTVTAKSPDGTVLETFGLEGDFGAGGGKDLPAHCSDEDFDEDGLGDGDELLGCTSPYDPDSDGDGYEDGEEDAAGSDPCDESSVPAADDDNDDDDDDNDDSDDDDDNDDDDDDDSVDDDDNDDNNDDTADDDDDEGGCCG